MDLIKTGGENVACREVEKALYLIPEVFEAAVIGLPHPCWVEAVVAIIVVKSRCALTEAQVLAAAQSRLASLKTPKHILFVEALPKTPAASCSNRQLREAYARLFTDA